MSWTIVTGPDVTRAERSATAMIEDALSACGAGCAGTAVQLPAGDAVIIGTAETSSWIAEQVRANAVAPPRRPGRAAEGFHVVMQQRGPRRLLLVAGSGSLGVLYGADEVTRRIRHASNSDLADLNGLDLMEAPHFPMRGFKMVPPLRDDYVAARRLNTIYLPTWQPVGTDFAGVYAGLQTMGDIVGLTPDGWSALEWWEQRGYRGRFSILEQPQSEIERQIDLYRTRLAELRELGVSVFLSRYEWGFPVLTLARRFADEVMTGGIDKAKNIQAKDISLCLSSERMQEIIRLTYARSFELFPELSGVVIYTSAEGGFGTPCRCERCAAAFAEYESALPAGFRISGLRAERGSSEVRFFHTWAFDLIYAAVKEVRPEADVVRNVWDFQPVKSPLATEYVHRQTPEDVIFMPYTVSTDTNLREDPNPQVQLWTRRGRRVVPKMCQLVEMHPRSGCFPNDMVDRVRDFYQIWGREGAHGVVLHGGWFTGEHFRDYAMMEDNIGFGMNLELHWRLLWDPFRDDVQELKRQWVSRVYGTAATEVVSRCLTRAGRIYRLGPKVKVGANPSYWEYYTYATKADGVGGDVGFLYPFGFDMLLLNDKLTHKFLANPAFMHREFVYNYQNYTRFQSDMADAMALLDANIAELERLSANHLPQIELVKVAALQNWFEVERCFLRGFDLVYQAEELYLIHGEWDCAAKRYGQAHDVLTDALTRWGRIAIEQAVWPFAMGGHFYPYRGVPLDLDGQWLEVDVFGVFLRWLAARRDDPRGGDVIGTYESGPDHFLRGLAEFRWPME